MSRLERTIERKQKNNKYKLVLKKDDKEIWNDMIEKVKGGSEDGGN